MEGEQPQLGDLLTMVINHLLNGMILQVLTKDDPFPFWVLALRGHSACVSGIGYQGLDVYPVMPLPNKREVLWHPYNGLLKETSALKWLNNQGFTGNCLIWKWCLWQISGPLSNNSMLEWLDSGNYIFVPVCHSYSRDYTYYVSKMSIYKMPWILSLRGL